MRRYSLLELVQAFGRFGERLYHLARGEDERPVSTDRTRKSVSVEETYAQDLPDLEACQKELPELLERLRHRLLRAGNPPFKGLSCKLKFSDFSQTTVEQTGKQLDALQFAQLLRIGFARGARPVRLLGVGVKLVAEDTATMEQLSLFD